MLKFPNNFKFGAATSGPQSEGSTNKKNLNVFEEWYNQDPYAFFNHVGPRITSDFYHNYPDDIKLLKTVGIKIYRTSIQWSRIYKDFDNDEIDLEAVAFYRDYFTKIKDAGIELIVNLYHFDTPMYYQAIGGWENKAIIPAFTRYAAVCFAYFNDLVDKWTVMNEIIVVPEACYNLGLWYPHVKDFKRAVQVTFNMIVACAKTIWLFRQTSDKEIGVILNLTPAIAKSQETKNQSASNIVDLFYNNFFLDIFVFGKVNETLIFYLKDLNALPDYDKEELEILSYAKVDFLGVNYYHPKRVQAPKIVDLNNHDLSRYYQDYIWDKAIINQSRGWEIYPKALILIADNLKNNYENIKWFLAENGIGIENEEQFENQLGVIQDDYRIDFINQHLIKLHEAIINGANCFAYCVWTAIDCWSWANAYKNRYGLISVDISTQKRTIKKSGQWYKALSDLHELSKNIK